MRAGALRKSGTLQRRTESRDDYGGQETLWQDVGPVRFELQPTGGHEIDVGGSARSQSMFTIVMRYRPGISTAHRIVMGSRIFNITNVTDVDERHHELDITAVEGMSPGQSGSVGKS